MNPATRNSLCAYQAAIQIIRSMEVIFLDQEVEEIGGVTQRAQRGEIKLNIWDNWIKELTSAESELKKEAEVIAKCDFQ